MSNPGLGITRIRYNGFNLSQLATAAIVGVCAQQRPYRTNGSQHPLYGDKDTKKNINCNSIV